MIDLEKIINNENKTSRAGYSQGMEDHNTILALCDEVQTLRELVGLYKERDNLQKKPFYPPEEIARLFELRSKIAELTKEMG